MPAAPRGVLRGARASRPSGPPPYTCATRWPSPPRKGTRSGERGSDSPAPLPAAASFRPAGERTPREVALHFPLEPRKLPRLHHRRLRLLDGRARRDRRRLFGADDRARRSAPPQHRHRVRVAEPGRRTRISRPHDRHGARRRLPDRLSRGAAVEHPGTPPLPHHRLPADRDPSRLLPRARRARGCVVPRAHAVNERMLRELELAEVVALAGIVENESPSPFAPLPSPPAP